MLLVTLPRHIGSHSERTCYCTSPKGAGLALQRQPELSFATSKSAELDWPVGCFFFLDISLLDGGKEYTLKSTESK